MEKKMVKKKERLLGASEFFLLIRIPFLFALIRFQLQAKERNGMEGGNILNSLIWRGADVGRGDDRIIINESWKP